MFDSEELKSLERQQELLVAESEIRRRLVVAQAAAFREELSMGRTMVRHATSGSLLATFGALAGMFAWRKHAQRFRWLPLAFSAWKFARRWLRP